MILSLIKLKERNLQVYGNNSRAKRNGIEWKVTKIFGTVVITSVHHQSQAVLRSIFCIRSAKALGEFIKINFDESKT